MQLKAAQSPVVGQGGCRQYQAYAFCLYVRQSVRQSFLPSNPKLNAFVSKMPAAYRRRHHSHLECVQPARCFLHRSGGMLWSLHGPGPGAGRGIIHRTRVQCFTVQVYWDPPAVCRAAQVSLAMVWWRVVAPAGPWGRKGNNPAHRSAVQLNAGAVHYD